MEITAISTERFVKIYEQLTGIIEHKPSSTTIAYSGTLSGTGDVVITSDSVQCLMFR